MYGSGLAELITQMLSRAEYILYTTELLLVLPERGTLCE